MGSINKIITGGRPHCTHFTTRNEVGHQILKQVPYHSQSQFSVLVGWIISKKNTEVVSPNQSLLQDMILPLPTNQTPTIHQEQKRKYQNHNLQLEHC